MQRVSRNGSQYNYVCQVKIYYGRRLIYDHPIHDFKFTLVAESVAKCTKSLKTQQLQSALREYHRLFGL